MPFKQTISGTNLCYNSISFVIKYMYCPNFCFFWLKVINRFPNQIKQITFFVCLSVNIIKNLCLLYLSSGSVLLTIGVNCLLKSHVCNRSFYLVVEILIFPDRSLVFSLMFLHIKPSKD